MERMDPRVAPFYAGFRGNTRLLFHCFEDVGETLARERPGAHANSMEFLAMHLVEARGVLLGLLGVRVESPFPELESIRTIDQLEGYPPLEEVLTAWRAAGARLDDALVEIEAEELDADSPHAFPLADGSVLGGLAFLFHHESYHLGQLGLIRRLHGLPAVRHS